MPAQNVLNDLVIADLTSVIFGPYCTQTLADMGARVIKVEPESGDQIRFVGTQAGNSKGMGPCHLTLNRGKESVVWGLKTEAGRAALEKLVARSDVFIHNIRQDAIERAGLTFDAVKAIKPDIVYVHCVGFGSDGPYAGRPAYDDLIQGLSGATSLLPRVDGDERPRFLPTAIADKVSGLHAVYATLAALRKRDQSGEAVFVEVPMFEAVTHFLLQEHFDGATYDPPSGAIGMQRQLAPARQPLKTSDGWIVIAPYMEGKWLDLFEVFNAAHELDNPKLSTRALRYENMDLLFERLQHYLRTDSTANWLAAFAKADIPAAPVNDLSDLQADPHLKDSGFFQRRDHPSEGGYWEMQPPVRFGNVSTAEIRPAPHIGEHTERVLAELGLGPEHD
ncbi:MAG: CoA transferase [Pseudomonadota bacterium]